MDPSKSDEQTAFSRIQTYALVTVVAALIWLYSESENVKQQKPLHFTVRYVAPRGQQLLILPLESSNTNAANQKQQIDLTVRCATSQYAQLQGLQTGSIDLVVTEDPDKPTQIVDLRDLLLDSPIGDLGVTFEDIKPRRVRLRIERIEPVTIPVDVIVAEGVQLATSPTAEPAESVVSLPRSIAQRRIDLNLEAHLDREAANRLDPNVPRAMTLPVTLRASETLGDDLRRLLDQLTPQVEPSTTTVTVTIRKQTDYHTLTSVPILLTGPWAELKRFSIVIEDDRRVLGEKIRITGPSDVIEKIESGQLKVWADLRLTADDLESGITSKQVHINVPHNVQIESTIPRLNFTITPVAANAPSPAP